LGGLYFDNSVRLEPSQVAGFNQAYRSLIPESIGGLTAGTSFETWGLALDQRWETGTYFSLEGEILKSSAQRSVGVFDLDSNQARPSELPQNLRFRERSVTTSLQPKRIRPLVVSSKLVDL